MNLRNNQGKIQIFLAAESGIGKSSTFYTITKQIYRFWTTKFTLFYTPRVYQKIRESYNVSYKHKHFEYIFKMNSV